MTAASRPPLSRRTAGWSPIPRAVTWPDPAPHGPRASRTIASWTNTTTDGSARRIASNSDRNRHRRAKEPGIAPGCRGDRVLVGSAERRERGRFDDHRVARERTPPRSRDTPIDHDRLTAIALDLLHARRLHRPTISVGNEAFVVGGQQVRAPFHGGRGRLALRTPVSPSCNLYVDERRSNGVETGAGVGGRQPRPPHEVPYGGRAMAREVSPGELGTCRLAVCVFGSRHALVEQRVGELRADDRSTADHRVQLGAYHDERQAHLVVPR